MWLWLFYRWSSDLPNKLLRMESCFHFLGLKDWLRVIVHGDTKPKQHDSTHHQYPYQFIIKN